MSSSIACSLHPDARAAFHCAQCSTDQCASCADHRWTGSSFADLCRTCQAPLAPLASRGHAPGLAPPGNLAYLARLRHFASFPFRRDTLFLLLWVAASISLLQWLHLVLPGKLGMMALVFSVAVDIAVYVHFVTRTALGKEGLRPEDLDDLELSVIRPAGRYALALAPIGLGVLWYVWDTGAVPEQDLTRITYAILTRGAQAGSLGPVLLIAAGLLLLPLLTIIAAMGSARSVIDPRMWLVALRNVAPTYPAGALAFYAVWAVEHLLWLPLLAHAEAAWSVPVLTRVLVTFLSYLPMALRARLLGGIIEPHREHFE